MNKNEKQQNDALDNLWKRVYKEPRKKFYSNYKNAKWIEASIVLFLIMVSVSVYCYSAYLSAIGAGSGIATKMICLMAWWVLVPYFVYVLVEWTVLGWIVAVINIFVSAANVLEVDCYFEDKFTWGDYYLVSAKVVSVESSTKNGRYTGFYICFEYVGMDGSNHNGVVPNSRNFVSVGSYLVIGVSNVNGNWYVQEWHPANKDVEKYKAPVRYIDGKEVP